MALDIRPPLAPFDAIFARPATVTPTGGAAVVTNILWDQEVASPDDMQVGANPSTNRRLVAWVRRDAVPSLPQGSTILGGPVHQQKLWRVQNNDTSDPDFHIAAVT